MTSSRDRFDGDVGGASEQEGSQAEGAAPGKRPLTLGLTVQRKVTGWIQRLAAAAQTAAHEAAHVVQQRGGVSLKGGIGAEGDEYEQHADAVADQVVAGRSAEGLLDRFAPAGGRSGGGVQMRIGANQPSGTKVRIVATVATGAISGNPVWGKYPVKWDADGKTTQVDPTDDAYEVVTPVQQPVVQQPVVQQP